LSFLGYILKPLETAFSSGLGIDNKKC